MNRQHFGFALACISAALVSGAQCTRVQRQEYSASAVEWKDTLDYAGSRAVVRISGQFPACGSSALADSAGIWIADNLEYAFPASGTNGSTGPEACLSEPDSLVAMTGRKYLEAARKDFESLAGDGFRTNYEASAEFLPVASVDKVLTYTFVTYNYSGGAHGSTRYLAQSFRRTDGTPLVYDFVFPEESRARLVSLIRDGLWEQYFKGHIVNTATLADALLVSPDDLALPVAQPEFREDGVTFTYQQYEIAPYAAGMPSCTLSYEELIPLMSPEAAALCGQAGHPGAK